MKVGFFYLDTEVYYSFLSEELVLSSSLLASLNSLIPLPRPRISSGIFLPPNKQ